MLKSESKVEDLVSAALLFNDSLGSAILEVKGAGGVITLKGTIGSERDKLAVESLVRAQEGVVRVVNKLKVPDF